MLYTVANFIISCVNTYTLLTFLVVFLLTTHGLKHRSQNLPPGPWNLPYIGNFLGLVYKLIRTGDEPEYQLADIARRYGDVFTLRVGSRIVIIANSYKSIKEAYQNPLISDRPNSKGLEESSMDEGKILHKLNYITSMVVLTQDTLPHATHLLIIFSHV